MTHGRQIVRMSESGRISIPAKQRRQLGLEAGGMVVTQVEQGELRIRPVRAVLTELQEKVSGKLAAAEARPRNLLSDELIADRRAEAAREAPQDRRSPKAGHAGDS